MAKILPPSGIDFVERFTGSTLGNLTACMFVPYVAKPYDYGVVSVSDDKRLSVWLKFNNILEKVVFQQLEAGGTAMAYDDRNCRLFVGLDSGIIKLYNYPSTGRDYRNIQFVQNFAIHEKPIVGMGFSASNHWLLSCATDNIFSIRNIKSGEKLVHQKLASSCTGLQFDYVHGNAFISDTSGNITVVSFDGNLASYDKPFKLHAGSINNLLWSSTTRLLYSTSVGSLNIVVWDAETRETKYELTGHEEGTKIPALAFSNKHTKLFSAGEDSTLVIWEQRVVRTARPTPVKQQWCSGCKKPFLWNVPTKVAQLKVGVTYNHCQRCGESVCHSCSLHKLPLPAMGFEVDARLCKSCYFLQKRLKKIPLAIVHNTGEGAIKYVDIDDEHQFLLTAGCNQVKIWNLTSVMQYHFIMNHQPKDRHFKR